MGVSGLTAAADLRGLLQGEKPVHAPGIYDCLSGKIAEHCGFEAVVLSGFGYMASSAGLPDIGIETRDDILGAARRIVAALRIPVLVDASEGYGAAAGLFQTVRGLEQAGAAGMLLGDQVTPAICPMLGPPDAIPLDDFCAKISFVRNIRRDKDFILVARTDAGARYGVDDAVVRARAYLEAGADIVFPVAGVPKDRAGLRDVVERIGGPMMTAPSFDMGLGMQDYAAMGIRMVSGLEAVFAAADGMKRVFEQVRDMGTVADPARHSANPSTISELNRMMGWDSWFEVSRAF